MKKNLFKINTLILEEAVVDCIFFFSFTNSIYFSLKKNKKKHSFMSKPIYQHCL